MLSQAEKVENFASRIEALRSKIRQLPEDVVLDYFRFFESGLLKKVIGENNLQYDDSDFIYVGSRCDRVDIWVLNYFGESDKDRLCVPSLTIIRNLKGFVVM